MDYRFKPISKNCAGTDKPLVPGTLCYSVLVERNGVQERLDFSEEGWTGLPEGGVGCWKSLVPEGARKQVSTTDPDVSEVEVRASTIALRADGTLTATLAVGDISVSINATWEIVGGKLITIYIVDGETQQYSEAYTLRDDRLTLVDDDDGTVEVWERQS